MNKAELTKSGPDSLLDKKKSSTPQEFAEHVRSLGDVCYWAAGGFWLVTDYDLAKKALRDPELSCDRSSFFVSRMPNLDLSLIPDFFGVVKRMMIMNDGAEHQKRRGVAHHAFSDEVIRAYGQVARKTVDRLLKEMGDGLASGNFEFAANVARKLPSLVLADLFSIGEAERPDFFRWSLNMTQFFGGASQYRNQDGIEVNVSAKGIVTYLQRLVAERTQTSGDDFLSMLIEENRKIGLDEPSLIAQAVMMLVAGQVTTTDQINNNLFTLLSRQDVLEDLKAHPEALPTAIEEFNRWDPGVTFLFRVAKEATRIGQAEILPGDVIFVSTHGVHRDPTVFADPEKLDIRRSPNPHFAYGHGAHFCLGAPLARLQMMALFGGILERFPAVKLAETERDHYSLAFSGFKSLGLN